MPDTASSATPPFDAFRALEPDFVPDPAHQAWMEAEIRRTLKAKADGKMTYRTLEEVARKFGAHAG